MGNPFSQINWGGTIPGADAFTYCLWATADPGAVVDRAVQNANRDGACGKRFFATAGIRKFVFSLKYSQGGTLNEYMSPDRGVTWRQISTTVVGVPVATATLEQEFLVESYPDWKLEWVNGGAAQTPWEPEMALTDQRAIP
jgi:hypothetical protein